MLGKHTRETDEEVRLPSLKLTVIFMISNAELAILFFFCVEILVLTFSLYKLFSIQVSDLEKNHPVPVDFMISENTGALVITGPNTGGKTISLKTVGLASLMAKTGRYLDCFIFLPYPSSVCRNFVPWHFFSDIFT